MTARVRIRIRPDGTVEAVTEGLKGDACRPYIARLEELTDGKVVKSHWTAEYYEGRETAGTGEEAEVPPESKRIEIGDS